MDRSQGGNDNNVGTKMSSKYRRANVNKGAYEVVVAEPCFVCLPLTRRPFVKL